MNECPKRPAGAPVREVGRQVSETGSYRPPVLRKFFPSSPPQMSISCPVQTAGWPSRPAGALVVVVAAQVLVERFQRAPVSAKGTIGESCPPQTIIWSVTSMRVNTAECAARAVGASTIEIGDQLSAKTNDPVINKIKPNSIRRMTIKPSIR